MKKTCFYIWLLALFLSLTSTAKSYNIAKPEKIERKIPENFKENYTGKQYIYERQDPTWLVQVKQWLLQKLLNMLQYMGVKSDVLYHVKLIFYIVIAFIAIYVVARMVFYKEGNWIFKKTKENNTLVYQDDVETIEISDFDSLIEKATQQEDFRLATKFLYLKALQKMAKKEILELSNLKTNIDYQLEIEGTSFYKSFKKVSYYYTYVWYGEFAVDHTSYEKLKPTFQELLNTLES